jgi:hypothetical protein
MWICIHLQVSGGTYWVSPFLHLRIETDPVSETLCFLVVQRLRLDISKGPNTVGVSIPQPEEEKFQFLKLCVF